MSAVSMQETAAVLVETCVLRSSFIEARQCHPEASNAPQPALQCDEAPRSMLTGK